jgi:AcrR family transcriptional regulator
VSTHSSTVKRGATVQGPKRDTPRSTRERILDAAAKTVARHGVGAATTKRIAAAAKVSEGSLYNHFADKSQLLIALVLERLPSIRDIFAELARGPDGAALSERLSAAMVALIDFYGRAQPIVGGVLSDPKLLKLSRKRFIDTDEGPHRAHEKLTGFLKSEQQSGRLRKEVSAEVIASVLIGACTEFAVITQLTGRTPGDLDKQEYARALIATLSPALFPPSEKRPAR